MGSRDRGGRVAPYAPRRLVLDQILVEAAARAGVEVRESFAVDGLVVEDGMVRGIRGRTPRAAARPSSAPGSSSVPMARTRWWRDAVGAAAYHEVPALEALYLAYWSGLPTGGEFQLYLREDRAIAAIPTNDGLTVGVVVWPIDEFEANRRDLVGNYLAAFAAEPTFAERIAGARRESRVVGKAMKNFYRASHGPGWALVGDAGYHKDAVTAQGITDAFRDAEALVGGDRRRVQRAASPGRRRSRRTRPRATS